jgi:hypothetical protein
MTVHLNCRSVKIIGKFNLCLISFIACSCLFVPRRFKKEFDCYTGNYTGLDTLINTHGFYKKMVINDFTGVSGMKDGKIQQLGIDTSYYSVVFFNDGLFIGDVGVVGPTVSGQVSGTYAILFDTIKIKYISKSFANGAWYGAEVWYKIIDKNTIVDFYRRPLGLVRSDRRKEAYQPMIYSNSSPSKFVHVPNMPKSYNWLKDEKWFNCEQ